MRTKIVYALVSNDNDCYLEQCLISAYSLRLHNPDACVLLVVDDRTVETLVDKRAKIWEYVTEVVTVALSEGMSNMERSRYLKTNLRSLVQGDYLFIDCDTCICESLADIDHLTCDVGMVADLNAPLALTDEGVIARCTKAGFLNVKGEPYFNSGVIYAKDNEAANQLYAEWYRLWQSSKEKGVPFDQPALCQANINLGHPIQEISGIWNCQFKFSLEHLHKAKVLHYYFNGSDKYALFQTHILEMVKRSGEISTPLSKIIKQPRTRLYSLFSISEEKALDYFNSEMFHVYFDMPSLYERIMGLNKRMIKLIFKVRGIR